MTEAPADRRRQDVLVAFHTSCPRPIADDIAAWIERYPEFAEDLRIHAEASLAGIQDRHLRPEASDGLIGRTRAHALAVLDAARSGAANPASVLRFPDLLAAAGTDVPRLARALGLGRAPLVDLIHGRVVLPAPSVLLAALADALRASVAAVEAATRSAAPRMGPAKAEGSPSAPRRSFEDIVRDDPAMTAEQKAHWLALLERE